MKKFVLLASPRTGSNLLNSNLNQYNKILLHGEVFNPAFVGLHKEYFEKLNIKRNEIEKRDNNSLEFMNRIYSDKDYKAIGFHLFPGHSEKVLINILNDKSIKKIGLRRSLIPSYISLCEAIQTDVWLINKNAKPNAEKLKRKTKIIFEEEKFLVYKRSLDQFWNQVIKSLKETDQEMFPIWYSQIKNVDKLNDIAGHIGINQKKEKFNIKLKKQSKGSLTERVENFTDLEEFAKKSGLEKQLF